MSEVAALKGSAYEKWKIMGEMPQCEVCGAEGDALVPFDEDDCVLIECDNCQRFFCRKCTGTAKGLDADSALALCRDCPTLATSGVDRVGRRGYLGGNVHTDYLEARGADLQAGGHW